MTAIFTATVLGLGEIVRLSIAAWPQASHLAFGAIGAYIGGRIADQSGYLLLIGMFGVMFLLSAGAAMLIRTEKQ